MVSLTNQKEARNIRDLPFCYICGKSFRNGDLVNHDHVPPEAMFDKQDRNFPLKLRVHEERCHSALNLDDEIISQLIALLHKKIPSEENNKFKINVYKRTDTNAILAGFTQRNIEFLIRRWLKAFHAVLYKEALNDDAKFAIQTPFPLAKIKNGQCIVEPIKGQHYKFVECIKRNRVVNNLDYIECNNEKLRYECVWDKLSDNSWACIFAIDLYGWKDLGDVKNFEPRGCAGLYSPTNGAVPDNASIASKLEFTLKDSYPTDPFL